MKTPTCNKYGEEYVKYTRQTKKGKKQLCKVSYLKKIYLKLEKLQKTFEKHNSPVKQNTPKPPPPPPPPPRMSPSRKQQKNSPRTKQMKRTPPRAQPMGLQNQMLAELKRKLAGRKKN